MKSLLITALLSAILAFGSAWTVQDWRYGAKENERAKTQQAAEAHARATELDRSRIANAALAAAEARAVAARGAAAALATELAGLRAQVNSFRFSPGNSPAACPDTANTLADLLSQCAGRYSEVAAAADGHASDAQKLIDAWPRE